LPISLPNQPDSNPYPLQSSQPEDSQIAISRKEELTAYVKSFYRASWDWRSTRYHAQWDKFDRNYHSIYDPVLLGRKEPWQSTMFVGVSVQNVEVLWSQLYKTAMSPLTPVETEAGPDGDDLQAELIQDATAYEWMRSKFKVNYGDALKESLRYGSGFVKFFWEKIEDTRRRKSPMFGQSPQQFVSGLSSDQLNGNSPIPPPSFGGFDMKPQQVLLKNCLCTEKVHIRDIFPEPNTLDWKKYIHRQKMPFGWIVDNIKKKKFFNVAADLAGLSEGYKFDDDLRTSKADRKFIDLTRIWSMGEKLHTIWELNAEIPRKWINFDMPDGPDAEVLVPAKVLVASGAWLLSSEESTDVEGLGNLLKMDYIRTGEPYGKGVIEMILDEQDEINELRNLRVDNVNMIMNKMMAVFEKAIVNRKDFISQPGGVVRLKDQVFANGEPDIRKVITPIEFPDVAQSSFRETMEIERQIQERTGASRVTLGSSSQVRDTNQTLGGMELLKQMLNERIAAYGMTIEQEFLIEAARRTYALIYQNLNPMDMKPILGEAPVQIGMIQPPPPPPPPPGMPPMPQAPPIPHMIPRYLAFVFVPPEVVDSSYRFKPMGIFSMENKIVKSAQVMDAIKVMSMMPPGSANIGAAIQYVLVNLQGIPEGKSWFSPFPDMPGVPGGQPMMPPMLGGPPMPPPPGPPGPNGQPQSAPPNGIPGGIPGPGSPNHAAAPNTRQVAPGMKSGPHGNRPSFLPPNPIRRQPVSG
jgi:hypothetical protein